MRDLFFWIGPRFAWEAGKGRSGFGFSVSFGFLPSVSLFALASGLCLTFLLFFPFLAAFVEVDGAAILFSVSVVDAVAIVAIVDFVDFVDIVDIFDVVAIADVVAIVVVDAVAIVDIVDFVDVVDVVVMCPSSTESSGEAGVLPRGLRDQVGCLDILF